MAQLTPAQQQAAGRLKAMKASLTSWLTYRDLLDKAAAGRVNGAAPPESVAKIRDQYRDPAAEDGLATELSVFLRQFVPLDQMPVDAVGMAQLIVSDEYLTAREAMGDIGTAVGTVIKTVAGLPWPILAGAAVFALTMMNISSAADVAKEQEHTACVIAGACTDAGAWVKWGVVAAGLWLVWTQTKIPDHVGLRKRKGGRR